MGGSQRALPPHGVQAPAPPASSGTWTTYEALELLSDPGLTLIVYTAEPGTPTQDALNLLASWAATLEQEQRAEAEIANDLS